MAMRAVLLMGPRVAAVAARVGTAVLGPETAVLAGVDTVVFMDLLGPKAVFVAGIGVTLVGWAPRVLCFDEYGLGGTGRVQARDGNAGL